MTNNGQSDMEVKVDAELKKPDEKTQEKEEEKKEEIIPDYGGLLKIHNDYGKQYCFICILGFIAAIGNGGVLPFFSVAFREVLNVLTRQQNDENADLESGALRCLGYFAALGGSALILTLCQYYFWGIYGSKVSIDVRRVYFDTVIRQEIAYHEEEGSGGLNSRISTECVALQEAISTKMGFLLQQIGQFIVGMIIAFYYSWLLSLILLAVVPVLVIIGVLQGKLIMGTSNKADPFSDAGKYSQETLTSIRIVLAFPSLISSKLNDYTNIVNNAVGIEKKRQFYMGIGIAFFMFGLFGIMYPVALLAGSYLVHDGTISIGDMFGAFFAFFIGGMGLGQSGSVFGDINKGKVAANKFYHLLKREPKIRLCDQNINNGGIILKDRLEGNIAFNNIIFSYPSDNDSIILKQVSFSIEAGKTLAIVGPSGSGKSTIIALLERYYDPNDGDIIIDNEKIHNYHPDYLRSQIGLVSQMPLLFDASVEENIRGGIDKASKEDVIDAAKLANAHDFIMKLPNQYETNVGEMGGRLSGGQRQRIAIARAMLKKPAILLLDEATSALDSKSEYEVQEALDKISDLHKQTVVVIAHRLSTITNADKILVLVSGNVVEQGNHKELMQQNGVYSTLVKSQQLIEEKKLLRQKSGGSVQMRSSHNVLED